MGQQTSTHTLAAIMVYFVEHRTVRQADLIETLGVSAKTVRRCLKDLIDGGMPLIRDDDDPPDVFWSVPKDWFPNTMIFSKRELGDLVRFLRRLPRLTGRNLLLEKIVKSGFTSSGQNEAPPEASEDVLAALEDAHEQRKALAMRYYSSGRGASGTRTVSIQRIEHGPPTRFIAVCHRDGSLKTFRASNVSDPHLCDEAFRAADLALVERMVAEWVDGFHGGGQVIACAFRVRNPDSHWVKVNLPPGKFRLEERARDIRFSIETPAIDRLARFVVGLGDAVKVETPQLRDAVVKLARGALTATQAPPLAKAATRPVSKRRSRA